MQKAEGTTEQLISSARNFLGDKSPAWKTVRGVRGSKDDEEDVPDLPENAKLRPYQDACVLGTLAHWGSGQEEKVHTKSQYKSVVAKVVLPTGTGKSWVIAVLAVVMAKKKGHRVLILTPTEEIRAGLLLKLHDFVMDYEVGDGNDSLKIVVLVPRGAGDGEKKKSTWKKAQEEKHKTLRVKFDVAEELDSPAFKDADIVVSNYQTINAERIVKDRITEFQVVLVDEAHHAGAESYQMLFEECKPSYLCHLTATPIDSQGNNICGTRVPEFKYTLEWAESHNLVKKRKLIKLDKRDGEMASAIETKDGSNESNTYKFDEEKHKKIARETINECIRLRKLSGQPHVALAKAFNKDEADKLYGTYNMEFFKNRLIDVGEYAVVLTSDSVKRERDDTLKMLEEGKCMVCIVVGMLMEGYDNQLISVIAWHCRTNSPTRFYQFLGRGLRRLQHKYLEEKRLLGVCGKQDKRDIGGPQWPPGDPDEIENKEVTQANLDEKEQECVMVVSHEDFRQMEDLYKAIGGDMEGKHVAVESDSSHEEERGTALEERRKRKRGAAAKDGSERAKRQKLSDDEKSRRRDARIQRQIKDAERIDAGHEADRLFNDNARQSRILSLEQNFEKWQQKGNNGQKDANEWSNDPAIDEKDKELLEDLENPVKQHDWRCHLYRCAVKDLADGGSEVNRAEALQRVDFRWDRARRNSPVLKALLDEATHREIPKDEPLFLGTVKFKES